MSVLDTKIVLEKSAENGEIYDSYDFNEFPVAGSFGPRRPSSFSRDHRERERWFTYFMEIPNQVNNVKDVVEAATRENDYTRSVRTYRYEIHLTDRIIDSIPFDVIFSGSRESVEFSIDSTERERQFQSNRARTWFDY